MSPIQTKVLSLRIPEELAVEVAAVAHANRLSVSRAIRSAVEDYVSANVNDPEFQKRVKKRLEDDLKAAQQLAARVSK
jgi:response regulator RpfG family c-di-GMP phosphodiesterase